MNKEMVPNYYNCISITISYKLWMTMNKTKKLTNRKVKKLIHNNLDFYFLFIKNNIIEK